MKTSTVITALAATLILNSVNARSDEKITCKTGFFSSDTFSILSSATVVEDLGYTAKNVAGVLKRATESTSRTQLFSNRKLLDTHVNYKNEPSRWSFTAEWQDKHVRFFWKDDDMIYRLKDSYQGWFLTIDEKAWSASEGDHWESVLKKTYCK